MMVTRSKTSSPEAEGQSGWVTRVCTRCSPQLAAHCSSELQFLRSLSLLIVRAMRSTILIGARIFTSSRCPIVCRLEMRFKVSFDSRACVHSRELDTITRLILEDLSSRPSSDYYVDPKRNIISVFFFSRCTRVESHEIYSISKCQWNFDNDWLTKIVSGIQQKWKWKTKDWKIRKFWNSDTWIKVEETQNRNTTNFLWSKFRGIHEFSRSKKLRLTLDWEYLIAQESHNLYIWKKLY